MPGKRGKVAGYYSKANRHARAMAKCNMCKANAGKILMKKRRAAGPKNSTRYPGRSALAGLRGLFKTPRVPRAPRAPRVPRAQGTMTPEDIAAAGSSMAARISARMAARRERRMMRANDTSSGIRRSNSIGY